MNAGRCPVLVGRRGELDALRTGLDGARSGRGGVSVLTGPAGIGKSRLAREVADSARARDVPVIVGRAVEVGRNDAFRPIGEALLAGLRRQPEPDDPALAPFRPVLGRLIPQWRHAGVTPHDSVVVLSEAVLRLLGALAGERGLLVVLEDLHWADPETLAVVEYLADNLAEERVVVVATTRDEPCPALRVLHNLAERQAARVFPLVPLRDDEIDEMAEACLGAPMGDALLEVLRQRSGGTPLLIEELLAAGTDPATAVPATVTDLVGSRVTTLPPDARRCVNAAATLGTHFDWRLLPAMTDLSESDVASALREATEAGLFVVCEREGFRFHHALGRDAVLAAQLPPEQVDWAGRGLAAVAAWHPDLDGAWCDVAADLALRAEETDRATTFLAEAGRRNLARGALESAETVLRRARDLGGEDRIASEVEESLAEVLAQAGKTEEAAVATMRSITLLDTSSTRAFARAHLRLARIHATAGQWATADEHIAQAQAPADAGLEPQITVAAAQIALGDSRFPRARELARAALADGRATAEVTSDALMVLGRIARRDDLGAAEELFSQARAVAEDAGLAIAATRALEELAIGDVQESLRLDRLEVARARAAGLGDLATVAVLDLHEAATLICRWEPERGRRAANRCAVASRRFGLATLPKALVLRAAADVHLGQSDAAEEAMAEALLLAPDDTHLRGEVWGVRAFRALISVADDRAFEHLERAMAAYALRKNEVTGSPAVGLWVLLSVVVDPQKAALPAQRGPITNRWNRGMVRFAEAVALGRLGDGPAAAAAFAEADAMLRRPVALEWHRLQGRRLVAEAALVDGWGDPGRWVGADLPLVEARGQRPWVAAQRGLLRRAGVAVPVPAPELLWSPCRCAISG